MAGIILTPPRSEENEGSGSKDRKWSFGGVREVVSSCLPPVEAQCHNTAVWERVRGEAGGGGGAGGSLDEG